MNLLLAIPIEVRLVVLTVLGAVLGAVVNWGAYTLAWNSRPIGPWSPPHRQAPPRRRSDRIPVWGWLGLRREAGVHGRGFWIRPLAIELTAAIGCATLYWLVVDQHRPFAQLGMSPADATDLAVSAGTTHAQFLSQILLITLMGIASLIDLDEQTIPDAITVNGTLAGLLLAALLPLSLLPNVNFQPLGDPAEREVLGRPGVPAFPAPLFVSPVSLAAPQPYPAALAGAPRVGSLAVALLCYAFAIFAVMRRPWYTRHGLRRAVQICLARMAQWCRHPLIWGSFVTGSLVIAGVWLAGHARWAALFSALVGMIGGGLIVWSVRLVGAATLKREAIGFGDVLLMMMIGTFVGWQGALIIFFLAPLAAIGLGIVQLVAGRGQVIPYGPFLCLATVFVLVQWHSVWTWAENVFHLPWIVPACLAVCLVLMALLLTVYQWVKEWWLGE